MPNVMNLRGIPEGQIEALRAVPGVWKVEIDQYHPNVVKLHDSIPLIRGLSSQISGAGYSADGTGVRVCIVDTGIDMDHIMYSTRIDAAASYDFYNNDSNPDDDNGHGSHCAGIAAGGLGLSWDPCGTGSIPLQGVAPNATLIGAKVLNSGGGGFDSDIIAGIDHCADQSASGGRADVISMSIGTGNYSGLCSHSWAVAANNAAANGVVAIAASGNENNSNSMGSPACGGDVIAVGMTWKNNYPTCEDATTNWNWGICTDTAPQTDEVGCFSNESDFLDVTAPGANIWSASNAAGGSSIAGQSGTSMSCPTVAGLAALVLQLDPTLTPAEVRQIIRDGAIDMGAPGFDRAYGYGRIDVLNTLALVGPQCTVNGDCDDGTSCTNDTCVSGSCVFTDNGSCECVVDGDCDDGNGCTSDTCSAGTCSNACPASVASFPYSENFESSQGAWANVGGDDFDWSRDSGGTPSNNTGPSGDHTTGSGWYMYIETSSPRVNGDTAILEGPCVDLSGASNADLTFWYHMFGAYIDTLDVDVSTDCSSWSNVWSLSGAQGNVWSQATVDLSAYAGSTVTIRFVGTRGTSWAGDIAIDDITIDLSAPDCTIDNDCDDGQYCNGAETCSAGSCISGSPVNCNDGVACTADSCNEGSDSCDNTPNNANCDDGQWCNGSETCDAASGCLAGTAVNCDDAIACTSDSCNEASDSCNHAPDNGACSDGVFCNGVETCSASVGCQGGAAVDCNDGVGCTDDSCNEGTDSCDNVANNGNCDDGLFCNGSETCNAASDCQAGSDPCPGEICQEATDTCVGCTVDGDCNDGQYCNGTETCNAGTCQSGTAVSCNDGVGCTIDSCNEGTDSCDNIPSNGLCDDGLFCNGTETCDSVSDCLAGSDPCGGETCDEGSDSCGGGSSAELWMSFRSNTSVPGVGTVADEDIVAYDIAGGTWSLVFDGSDVGIGSLEISGMAVLPSGDILMTFTAAGNVGGLSVDDSDIVAFAPTSLGTTTSGSFSLYFDGSDVGLTSNGEDVDSIALAPDGRLIISSTGGFSGTGSNGADEDLMIFTDTSLGSATAGSFAHYMDSSDLGMGGNSAADIDAAGLTSEGNVLISIIGNTTIGGVPTTDEDVLEFTPTSTGSSTSGSFVMYLDLSTLGIASNEDIGSLELVE